MRCAGHGHAVGMAMLTVNDVLEGHVGLDLECLDRVYLNAYVPNLQVGGQVVSFLTAHLGNPNPSPAIFEKIGMAFRRAVSRFADQEHIPVVRFEKTGRKIDMMAPHLAAQAATGLSGVAAVGVAQEFAPVFTGTQRDASNGIPWFSFAKANRRVTCYYFYVWDDEFGPGFIKICAYFPYPAKVWINGHEWAKRVRPSTRASGSPSCPTDSPPPTTRPGCSASVTGSGRGRSPCSSNAGCRGCRCRSPMLTGPRATGGSCRCSRSRSRAPSCSPSPATPEASSKPSSPTTLTSAARSRSN